MSKLHNDSIFQLIKSLTKSEKRSVKLFVERTGGNSSKKITRLFDYIDKHKLYDEKKLLKSEKDLSRIQMPNLKAHLYQQIMKCLSVSTPKTMEMKVSDTLNFARILYNKCLYTESIRMLEKAKRIAIQTDLHVLLLEILELEKLALMQTVREGNEERIISIIEYTDKTAISIQNINAFSNLSIKLNSLYQRIGFIRNENEYKNVSKFFHTHLPKYKEDKISFHEKLYLYYSYTGYNFFIQDFKTGYVYAKKWVHLFDENPEMIYRKPELYIRALNALLVAQNKLLLFSEFQGTHRKLISLKRDENLLKTENINLNLFKTIYLHEINRHFMMGEFTAGTRIVRRFEVELNNLMPKLDNHSILIFYYKIACLYFGASNFRAAVVWLSKIINEKETELREDLHAFARIIRLISYFEIGNEKLAEHDILSTYRFLKKKGSVNNYQTLILNFLRKLKQNNTQKKLLNALSELKIELLKLESSQYEKRAFYYFDIISWIESKIERKTIEEVIKEKMKKKVT